MGDIQTPEALVIDFLKALENRDLETASAMLASGAKVVFPGVDPFELLDNLIPFARQRYQWGKKRYRALTL